MWYYANREKNKSSLSDSPFTGAGHTARPFLDTEVMMATIIRGTTPTIKYTFNTVDPTDITVAYLTIKQGDSTVIEKDLSDATVGNKYIAWMLTQSESLSLSPCMASFMCNWKKNDGTRGASNRMTAIVVDNDKDEVI